MNNFDNDFYNDFNEIDNDENVDVDEPSTIFSKFKSRFNKTTNNIKSKFNKNESDVNDSSSYEDDDNLENVDNVAFYRKKPFIFGSIGLVSIALLATAIAVPLSLQTTFLSTSVLKPISPTDFDTKLQIINNLPNNEKINIWNSYVNSSGVKLRWNIESDKNKILNFLKENYEPFIKTGGQLFNYDTQTGGPQINLNEMFFKVIDSMIARNKIYYDESTFHTFLVTTPDDKSFFDLSAKTNGGMGAAKIWPVVRFGNSWNGLSNSADNSGVSSVNVSINFSLEQMSILLPYNETSFLDNRYLLTDKNFFVFYFEDLSQPFKGFFMKPKNNILSIKNSDSIFSNFKVWMEDYLTKNYN